MNPDVSITKRFTFCYGHHLPDYPGKCAHQHGHNSDVEVELRRIGGRSSYPGMVMDFGDLKAIVEPLLETLDHKNLNDIKVDGILPLFATPTAENIVQWLVTSIKNHLPFEIELVRVRMSETPDSWTDWRA